MAPLVTHLVIGERVFPQLPRFDSGSSTYGAFLLGCLLVDVNGFSDIDRRQTHFVGQLSEDGEEAFTQSCAGFLSQLDTLLRHPWNELAKTEQAFVAGYLCHLAADEVWKEFTWNLLHRLGVVSAADLPAPLGVIMTAFSVTSARMFIDFPAIAAGLKATAIPDTLTHVPHDAFQQMWNIVGAHVLDGRTPQSYFEMLEREGMAGAEVETIRRQHAAHWDTALSVIDAMGHVEPYVHNAIERSAHVMPRLWAR